MRTRIVLAVSLLGVALGLGNLRPFAVGTPAGGPITTTGLNTGVVHDPVGEINRNGIQFKSKAPVSVVQVTSTGGAGFTSGWHTHGGPVFVTIKSGELTTYDASCVKRTYRAGDGFVERTGEPLLARNETSEDAVWYTTHIISPGTPLRINVTPGLCGLL